MSLVVPSASVPVATRAAAHAGVVEHARGLAAEARRPEAVQEGSAPKGRHALVEALREALQPPAAGVADEPVSANPASDDRTSRQAFHAFVHALFAELRPTDAEGRHGRGFAWGRTSSSDLAQRLDALVEWLQSSSNDDAAAVPEVAPTATPSPDDAIARATTPSTDDAIAPATDSVTADTPLLSAFRRLGAGAAEGGDATDASASLVAFLRRVSEALAGDAGTAGSVAAGSLLDVTA